MQNNVMHGDEHLRPSGSLVINALGVQQRSSELVSE
jgi:hypothetical protein